jgi:hypothetical protein
LKLDARVSPEKTKITFQPRKPELFARNEEADSDDVNRFIDS